MVARHPRDLAPLNSTAIGDKVMPTKRRVAKVAKLNQFHREMLVDGPELMLLGGVGFMEGRRAAVFDAADPDEQAAVLLDMRQAWERHGAKVLAEQRAAHGQSAPVWAERVFAIGIPAG